MRLTEKLARLIGNQSRISRQTGLAQSAISEIISGKRRPYFDQMAAIAKALDVSLDYLADDAANEPPAPEVTEDERFLIRTFRMLQLSLETAIRRLNVAPEVKGVGKSYGDVKKDGKKRA